MGKCNCRGLHLHFPGGEKKVEKRGVLKSLSGDHVSTAKGERVLYIAEGGGELANQHITLSTFPTFIPQRLSNRGPLFVSKLEGESRKVFGSRCARVEEEARQKEKGVEQKKRGGMKLKLIAARTTLFKTSLFQLLKSGGKLYSFQERGKKARGPSLPSST